MFFKKVTLFTSFGFKIKADLSWLFLSVLIYWMLAAHTFPRMIPSQSVDTYQIMALVTLACLMMSIIAHEIGHAIVAERYHMPIESITLFIFGGVAEMKSEPSHPEGEFLMALAGPAMSALLGGVFYGLYEIYQFFRGYDAAAEVLHFLGILNLIIAGFNIIPAFPLDGGRALRAVLWKYMGDFILATRISAAMGFVFSYFLIGYALWQILNYSDVLSGMWMGIMGLFLHAACGYSARQTQTRALLGEENVSHFLQDQITAITPDVTLSTLVDDYAHKHYQKAFPVVEDGKLCGVVTVQKLLSSDRRDWQQTPAARVMEKMSDENTIPAAARAYEALEQMQKHGREQLMVTDDQNRFAGIITFGDLVTFISTAMDKRREARLPQKATD